MVTLWSGVIYFLSSLVFLDLDGVRIFMASNFFKMKMSRLLFCKSLTQFFLKSTYFVYSIYVYKKVK